MKAYIIPETCQVGDLNKLYLDHFGYKTDGFFVDVGAYDGYFASNTYGLAMAGWEGICYEPVPESFTKCAAIYKDNKKIKCIQTCVGNRTGNVILTVAGTLSTFNTYHTRTKYWENDYRWSHQIPSPVITLDNSLRENNVKPGFELLSVDVEGSETDVLQGFDIDYWQPQMAIIETHELHEAEELKNQAPFINQYFADAGYKKIFCGEVNNVYVRD